MQPADIPNRPISRGRQTVSRLSRGRANALRVDARFATDPAMHKEIYNRIRVIAAADAPQVPLYDQPTRTVERSDGTGPFHHIACASALDLVYIVEH